MSAERPTNTSLSFIPNQGQAGTDERFEAHGKGGSLAFMRDQIVLTLPLQVDSAAQHTRSKSQSIAELSQLSSTQEAHAAQPVSTVRLRFDRANPNVEIAGGELLPGVVNYLIGNDRTKWHTHIPTYSGIMYRQIYAGIDLYYNGQIGALKGTYRVAPGADPSQIRWRYQDAGDVRLDPATGDLLIDVPRANQSLLEREPVAWQEIAGRHIAVDVRYIITGDGAVGFVLGRYDATHELTIDPTLVYSTYFGTSETDDAVDLAIDRDDNIYIVGTTNSYTFPTVHPIQEAQNFGDVFVTKFAADRKTIVYSTYVGGATNSDQATSIAVDRDGNAVITGWTLSTDFPTVNAIQNAKTGCVYEGCEDGFVTRLNAAGTAFDFSTYLGGNGRDFAYAAAVDDNRDIYVTGSTGSGDFPAAPSGPAASQPGAFIAKIRDAGFGLVFTTFLPGAQGRDIAVDQTQHVYLVGTADGGLRTVRPIQAHFGGSTSDAFVAKLTPDGGTVLFSTYLGGGEFDFGHAIALDRTGSIYIDGETTSPDFPTVNAYDSTFGGENYVTDAFVAKLSGDGQTLIYSTYLGSPGYDVAMDLAVDDAGYVYLTGSTSSGRFPTVAPLPNTRSVGSDYDLSDSFVAKLNKAGGALLFSTLLGGDRTDGSRGIALDHHGDIVVLGQTDSSDFPTVEPISTAISNAIGIGDVTISAISIPSTTLVSTLLDDVTGSPIANAAGTVALYAGATRLDSAAFTTDAQGTFRATFSGPISQTLTVEYSGIAGYARQYYSHQPTLRQATPVELHSGLNVLSNRLIHATNLTNRLMNDGTGQPIVNASGTLMVYSDTTKLEQVAFTTDTNGVAQIAFETGLDQTVRLGYQIDGFLPQYYDRMLSLPQSTPVELHPGANALTSHLLPATQLTNTLVNGRTGQPIGNTAGTLRVYSGTLVLDEQAFLTDGQGTFTTTFHLPISQDVRLNYSVGGFAHQFYDRKAILEQADPVTLHYGANVLTTHLAPSTTIANQLLDDITGQPLGNSKGSLLIYSGGKFVESAFATTDANGIYNYSFNSLIDGDVQIEYRNFHGYAQQFYDRAPAIDVAEMITLHPGANTFVTRLAPETTLVNTLIDDANSQPLANTMGVIATYRGTSPVDERSFRTDASGVYTVTFAPLLNQPTPLEYRAIPGHALQFYDRQLTLAQAQGFGLHPGVNRLTTRLLAAPVFANTLLDDLTGQPLPDLKGIVVIGTGLRSDSASFTTDTHGVYTTTLTNTPLGGNVPVKYYRVTGYADQYYDRAANLDQATPIALGLGPNTLTSRLIRATTLINTLLDDATGLPIANTTGFVAVYSGTLLLDNQRWKTDPTGVYTVSLSPLISQSVQLVYGAINYPVQFYDRKASLDQANAVDLHSGINSFTIRLHATRLVNTLIDDITGLPIRKTFGVIEVYSNSGFLEQQSFQTDASGVYTITLSAYHEQAVRLGYRINGYPYQFYNRQATLTQANPIELRNGNNLFTTNLIATRLTNRLINDATELPIAKTAGTLEVYSGTVLLEQRPFTTDSNGAFTATLDHLVNQQMRLGYNVNGFAHQFYDRKLTLSQADPLGLTIGQTTLSTRLLGTTLVNTLVDDLTGAPIRDANGTLDVYSGTLLLAQPSFRTDASGVYTITFQRLIDQQVQLGYTVDGYPQQFYDRKATRELAQPVALRIGLARLTTRLSPPTVLVNTLVDDITGQPIGNTYGQVVFYVGATPLTEAHLWTDASGTYTMPFQGPLNQDIRLEYRIQGYAFQYADRKLTLDQSNPIALHSGMNLLTTRLLPQPVLTGTLVDDWTGQPMPNREAWMTVHFDGDWQEGSRFTTDASGVYTVTFDITEYKPVPIEQPLAVEYGGVEWYLGGFYDHAHTAAEATPVILHSGVNRLTIRMVPKTALYATVLDDETGEPIRNTFVGMGFDSPNDDGTGGFGGYNHTDANGVVFYDLDAFTGPDYRVRIEVQDYPTQYHDRTTNINRAQPFALHPGPNMLTVRLTRLGKQFTNTLVDDWTGEPIRNIEGELWMYIVPDWHYTLRFSTDAQGVCDMYFWNIPILDDYVRLEYHLPGYPAQFYDRATSFTQAKGVLIGRDQPTLLTTRLVKTFPTSQPGVALITPAAGGTLTDTLGANFVSVTFPPNAVAAPITSTLTIAKADTLPPLMRVAEPAFGIAANTMSGTPVQQLASAFTLNIRYNATSVTGIDEQSLNIWYWDTTAKQWVMLPTTRDIAGNNLTASSNQLTRFAIFGHAANTLYLPILIR